MLYFTFMFHVIPKYYGKCIRGKSSQGLHKANLSSLFFLIAFVGVRLLNIWIYLISIREVVRIYYSSGYLKIRINTTNKIEF